MTLFCHCCTNQRSDACLISSSCNLANLIVNHNLSYETVTSSIPSQRKAAVASDDEEEKALLPKVVEMVLKRRTYFKELLKQIPKENIEESFWCEQRIEALKKILVCLYGTTGSV